jgi:gluconolactonase
MSHIDSSDPAFERVVSEEPLRKRAGGFIFTEGTVWHAEKRVVIFSDIPGNKMYTFNPATERTEPYRDPSNKANGNVFDHQHRLVTCEHATSLVVREEKDGTRTILASHFNGVELNSPNDVVVDQRGRLYFSDPPYGRLAGVGIERPQMLSVQGVYRVDPNDGLVVQLVDDFDRPNGLCLAEKETVLYVNDSARKHIRRFDIRDDKLSGGNVWAELRGDGPGAPDGMKVDSAGNILCCGPGGVHIFDKYAKFLGRIRVPEECCNFNWGDDDLRTLYMSSTTSLYSCRMHVPGNAIW